MEYPMQPPPPRRRPETGSHHPQPPPPPQKCPRCDSSNTKFCYYNNYSLAQPRYFCKACRRYWTHGGTLRNVPVGGSCRRSRHRRTTTTATSGVSRPPAVAGIPPLPDLPVRTGATILPPMGNGAGSFLSGGSFLSSLTGGMNPVVAAGGSGQYDSASMGLFQNLQFLQPPSSDQMFPTQQGLNFNPGRAGMSPWGHIFMRGSSSAAPSSTFWSRAAGASDNQTGSNPFHPNQWPDSNSG